MKIKTIAAVALCKLLAWGARKLRRGGTAMPGRWALKLCPDLAGTLARGVNILVITGTNGKTTTSHMVEEAFSEEGLDYLANRSGANLLSGIVTAFSQASTLTGRCRKKWAVIECDEAAARLALGYLQPRAVVVTNLFRDQLDRYGEVTHTLENIREGLKKTPDALLCLNADCSLTASLADDLPNPVRWYGLEAGAARGAGAPALSDATRCIRCKTEYVYDYFVYGHLGGFRCPGCGYARHGTDVAVTAINALTGEGSEITLQAGEETRRVRVNLPAVYNVYNAAAAVAGLTGMGLSLDRAVSAVEHVRSGFGRMERFDLGKAGTLVTLVKNPAGCDQVLRFLEALDGPMELALLLNDNAADGTDVSWIWDADFESFAEKAGERLRTVTVGGTRAWDMLLRLKYAGLDPGRIALERDMEALLDRLASAEAPAYIMPTYTALMELRPHLLRRCGGRDFWEG